MQHLPVQAPCDLFTTLAPRRAADGEEVKDEEMSERHPSHRGGDSDSEEDVAAGYVGGVQELAAYDNPFD